MFKKYRLRQQEKLRGSKSSAYEIKYLSGSEFVFFLAKIFTSNVSTQREYIKRKKLYIDCLQPSNIMHIMISPLS